MDRAETTAVGGADDRGVSEFTGLAILIGVTVLVTASVGLFVLVAQEEDTGPPDANFSFRYLDSTSALLVNFERGETIAAGNITVQGSGSRATWAELANANASKMVGPGATVQLSGANDYGQSVSRDDTVRVFYVGANGNRTTLGTWNG